MRVPRPSRVPHSQEAGASWRAGRGRAGAGFWGRPCRGHGGGVSPGIRRLVGTEPPGVDRRLPGTAQVPARCQMHGPGRKEGLDGGGGTGEKDVRGGVLGSGRRAGVGWGGKQAVKYGAAGRAEMRLANVLGAPKAAGEQSAQRWGLGAAAEGGGPALRPAPSLLVKQPPAPAAESARFKARTFKFFPSGAKLRDS